MTKHGLSPAERFWSKVEKGPNCWNWKATKLYHGYGYFTIKHVEAPMLAHRFSWEITFGPIPNTLCVLHHCDNPSCVNPKHLFLGTRSDNTQDMMAKKRWKKRETLSREQARSIRSDTRPVPEIAEEYGVSPIQVYNIRRGQAWKTA